LIADCYRANRNRFQEGAILSLLMHLKPTWLADVSIGSA
jgi:hypothetical protein